MNIIKRKKFIEWLTSTYISFSKDNSLSRENAKMCINNKMLELINDNVIDWNTLINEYHKISSHVWSNNIQTRDFELLEAQFILRVGRNAPKEANEILQKLKGLVW